jgi:DNA-binding transcriptional LysR family regulator
MPKIAVRTFSTYVRTNLVASGRFIATFPKSVARFYANRFALKVLPVDLPARPWPLAILTLKNRTLSPVVGRFIECTRELAKSMTDSPTGKKAKRRMMHIR